MASASAPPAEPPWPVPSLPALEASEARPSPGHAGGRYLARVWSSDASAYRAAEQAPVGLVVCASLLEASDRSPGPLLCMRRGAAGWRFAVALAGREGWVREGALDECVGCHSSAPRDGLFGP